MGPDPPVLRALRSPPQNPAPQERAKDCPQCGLLHFPRLAPAMIVLVERGNQLLMARSRHFAPGVYSVLAGFGEPGETLEEAVEREVFDEVGIKVKNIRYFGRPALAFAPVPHDRLYRSIRGWGDQDQP